MKTQFATSISLQEDSFEAGKEAAAQALSKLQTASVNLVILFCSTGYDYKSVIKGIYSLIDQAIPLIGCSTAGQFTEKGVHKTGVACALIASETDQFFCGMGMQLKNNPLKALRHAITHFPKETITDRHQSAILFVDGLAGKGEEAVMAATSLLGPQIKFVGGAAADNLQFKQTTVFCNQSASTDAASICLISSKKPIIVSVTHGHHPISPPLRITKSKDNILYELDGKPALEVWKEVLRERLKLQKIDIDALTIDELSKILLKYEAGLMTGSDYKIRFPASCNPDGSLNFVCTMMEGSVIKIMDSEEEDQIESARRAAEIALQSIPKGTQIAGALIFDCACRAMILEEQFSKAIEASRQVLGPIPFIGCETYGEIAMEAGQLSGFHNTATVMMLFPS